MWLRLRKTASRGRSVSPATRRRRRSWRFWRAAPRLIDAVIGWFLVSLGGLLLSADLAGLAGLAADLLARVAHALALVGLRLACRADLGRDLADELLVDADDRQAGRTLDLEADAGRRVDLDLVAVAQVELELLAGLRRSIADAGDLEALAVPVGHPDDHVVDEGPGQPVELLVGLLLRRPGDDEVFLLALDGHVRMELAGQLARGSGG